MKKDFSNVEDTHKHNFEIETQNLWLSKAERDVHCMFLQIKTNLTWHNISCLGARIVTCVQPGKHWLVMIVFYCCLLG